LFYFWQLVEGVMYCHARGLAHRDIKLENLLLSDDGKTLKITDFGFASNSADGAAKTVLGTAVYVAPEVLDGKAYDGQLVDMWACGVVLFAMVAGAYPFDFGYHGGVGPEQRKQNAELMKRLKKADYKLPANLSPELVELVGLLIQPDVTERLTAEAALKHAWALGGDRSAAQVDEMAAAMSHAAISTPDGHNPEQWLAVLSAEVAVAEAGDGTVDVAFDDGEDGF
jgi:serine/threonine protein kinase